MKPTQAFTIFVIGVLTLSFASMVDSLYVILACIYFYAFTVVLSYSHSGPADPRVFPVAFMAIYFTFFPVRASLFGAGSLPFDQSSLILSLKLQFVALIVFVTVSNLFINTAPLEPERSFPSSRAPTLTSEWLILLIAVPFTLYYVFMISSSGASSKQDIINNYWLVKTFSDFFMLIITILIFLRAVRIGGRYYRDKFIAAYFFFCIFYVLLTSERDLLFKVLFGLIIIYYDQRKSFGPFKMSAILSAIVLVVPISQYFKSILLSGTIDFNLAGADLFLNSEFISASRNFYSLLAFDVEHNTTLILSDMARAFIPTTLLGDYGVQSTVAWYDTVFRPENGFQGTSGWGFTIVGFGYVVGGLTGIVSIMTFYAWLLSAFYNQRWRSPYWYSLYILALSACVYVLRADLANLLSQVFKISGLAVLAIYMAHSLLKKPSNQPHMKDLS